MRKHIEALQQENEQLQEFANAKAEGREQEGQIEMEESYDT